MSNQHNNFLETSDSIIYFEVHGKATGTPIFILNGGPGFAHTYLMPSAPIWKKLGKDRPVIFYDQRGTGQSTIKSSKGTCTLKDQMDDLDALRDYLGYEQITLLGHSWGGFLGMAYTARYPAQVKRLILVDSAAPCFGETIFLQKYIFPEIQERRQNLAFAVELGDKEAIRSDTIEKFSMLFYSQEKKEALVSEVGNTAYNYDVNKDLWADLEKYDLTPEIKKFTQPTLVITGRFDMNVAPLVAYRIHKLIAKSKFEVFEYSGHLPFFEEPERFIQVIREFISE